MEKKSYIAPSFEVDYFNTESAVLTTSENDDTVIDPFNEF